MLMEAKEPQSRLVWVAGIRRKAADPREIDDPSTPAASEYFKVGLTIQYPAIADYSTASALCLQSIIQELY